MEGHQQDTQPQEEGSGISEQVLLHGMKPFHYGEMDQPDGHAVVTGPCGDTDEFFLTFLYGRIKEVRFLTTGCLFTIAACDATAYLAMGRTVREAMGITRETLLSYLGGLPPDHEHCALLAANTLHRALRSYVVKGTGL